MNVFFKTIRDFLLDYLPSQRKYSENTVKSYKDALRLLIQYLREIKQLNLSQIHLNIFNKELILEFLDWLQNERRCNAASRNQRLAALRSFFQFAAEQECTLFSLSLQLQKEVKAQKSVGKAVDFLSEAALKALLEQPDTGTLTGLRNLSFMVLMYETGARCGELLQLRLQDLRLNSTNPEVHLMGKGRKPRVVPLLPKTLSHIERYLRAFHSDYPANGNELLFYTVIHGRRNPMSADTVASFMKKYGEAARSVCIEVPERVHPHMMRHTRAMHFNRDGMPLVLLSEYLGHASAQTTRVYAFADTEMKRAAILKADPMQRNTPEAIAVWENNDEMIMRLSGLV